MLSYKTSSHANWSVYADVFECPAPRLARRCPVWSDVTPVNVSEQWREDWTSASVVISVLVTGQDLIHLTVHGPCSVAFEQIRDMVLPTSWWWLQHSWNEYQT